MQGQQNIKEHKIITGSYRNWSKGKKEGRRNVSGHVDAVQQRFTRPLSFFRFSSGQNTSPYQGMTKIQEPGMTLQGEARRGDPVSTASLTSPTDPTNAGTFLTVLTTDVRFEVPSQGRFIYCSSWLPPHRAIGYDVEERGSRLLRNTATFVSRLHAKIIVFKTSKPTHAICCLIQNERQSLNIFKKCQNFYTNWCTSF